MSEALDTKLVISAGWARYKYAQGTKECIAFNRGVLFAEEQHFSEASEDGAAFHLNNDKTVAVGGHEFHDMDTCPRGVKVLLLGPGDVATLASFDGHDPQWRGWFPVPRKRKSK